MSSLLSDSTIGMGGKDMGSIEQPIMDQEVISIGGSSSNDTHCSASGSESSSSKRVRTSRRTGEGTSCPYGRVRPSAATGELAPITMILPPSASRGVRRGSGGRDVRSSLHVRRSHSVGSPPSTTNVVGYKWVRENILKYKSSLTSAMSVAAIQRHVKLVSPENSYKLAIYDCGSDDYRFLSVTSDSRPFFYV